MKPRPSQHPYVILVSEAFNLLIIWQYPGTGNPKEFGVDLGYSRSFLIDLGLGIGLKYIYSNLVPVPFHYGRNIIKQVLQLPAILVLYHNSTNEAGQGWAFGVGITNLGAKIAYTDNPDQKDFIPANLGLALLIPV